jgi:hypothetical protein
MMKEMNEIISYWMKEMDIRNNQTVTVYRSIVPAHSSYNIWEIATPDEYFREESVIITNEQIYNNLYEQFESLYTNFYNSLDEAEKKLPLSDEIYKDLWDDFNGELADYIRTYELEEEDVPDYIFE